MPQSATWDRRFCFPSEGRNAEDFLPLKIQRLRPGLNPANLVTKGQHTTSGPPKPIDKYTYIYIMFATCFEHTCGHPPGCILQRVYQKLFEQGKNGRYKVLKYMGWNTVIRRLTTAIRFEKCVVRRFRRCANVIECTCTNLDSIAYYTPSLYGIAYCSQATNLYSMLLYWIL